uniref:Uncharacterized protein n=1 Tax=Opuntia streptacantha TaxID=393608 RepID=A0A7C9EMG1_OPUST
MVPIKLDWEAPSVPCSGIGSLGDRRDAIPLVNCVKADFAEFPDVDSSCPPPNGNGIFKFLAHDDMPSDCLGEVPADSLLTLALAGGVGCISEALAEVMFNASADSDSILCSTSSHKSQ